MRRIGCAALAFALVGCGRLGYETSDAGGPALDAGDDAGDAGGADGGVDASPADASPADASVAGAPASPRFTPGRAVASAATRPAARTDRAARGSPPPRRRGLRRW
jgi:hypothetical protein